MEFGIRHFLLYLLEGANRNVDSLVRLQSAWKKDDEFVIMPPAPTRCKHGSVDVINKWCAAAGSAGASGVFFQPEVVSNDHMISERGGDALHPTEDRKDWPSMSHPKLASEKLRDNVMNIKNYRGAR